MRTSSSRAPAASPATLEAMSRTRDLFIADIVAGQGRAPCAPTAAPTTCVDAALGLFFSVMLFWTAGPATRSATASTPPGGWSSTCWRSRGRLTGRQPWPGRDRRPTTARLTPQNPPGRRSRRSGA